jgi:hypothetical protein
MDLPVTHRFGGGIHERSLPLDRKWLPLERQTATLFALEPSAKDGYVESMSKHLSKQSSALAKSSRAHAEQLVSEVARLKMIIASSFYEMGSALGEILDQKLYGVLGYKSFEELLEERELLSARQARKFIDVSKAFERAPAVQIGPEKAYALIRYCARTEKNDDPGALVKQGFPVAGRRKPIDVVTVRDIEAATRTAVHRHGSTADTSERARRDVEAERRAIVVALHKRGAADVVVTTKLVRSSWKIVVELPAERARAVLRA